jgi:diguanylate cyclase (GGDEF)-like protein/PAS domain S-box-containing protein
MMADDPVSRDVKAHGLTEEANARLAAIVESSHDAILTVTLDGVIVTWNRSAERIYGYTADEIIGKSVSVLTLPGSEAQLAVTMERIRRGAAVKHFDAIRVRMDGSHVDVSLSISPIKDAAGVVIGASTIARDVTERKRAAEKVNGLNGELEERVLARTAQLAASNKENDELVTEATALAEDNATITRIAETDELTGLANRRHFHEALEMSVSFARRHDSPLAIVSLDLDGLKGVNDAAGHEAGDGVLASFAALLAALCRAEDLPARLGGDEFSVLLPGIEIGGALGLAERVLVAVRSCAEFAQRGVTVSVGIAAWEPHDLPSDLLRRADERLYAAKRNGGDSIATRD